MKTIYQDLQLNRFSELIIETVNSPFYMDLSDQVVVITGACGLLGKEFSKAILAHGGYAVIADIDRKKAMEFATELNQENNSERAIPFMTDINSSDSIEGLIKHLHERFGRINSLVNNAYPRNQNYGAKFFDVTYDDFCENITLNLGGYFLTSQKFSSYFMNQGFGNIINIASIYGVISPKFEIYNDTDMTMPVEYAFIKSGLIHFTRYLSRYLKGRSIRVNAISPGGIRNGQPEIFIRNYNKLCNNKGMLDSADLTGTLVFLLSNDSSYINGQNIIVDDGFTL